MNRPDGKKNFVGMPMKMFAYGHKDLFLNKNEENAFLLYYILDCMSRNLYTWSTVETSINMLANKCNFNNDAKRNRAEIKKYLLSLRDKGFITMLFNDSSLESDTFLTIKFKDLDDKQFMEAVRSDNFEHVGWVAVTEEMFKACNGNARYLKIMIYAEWRMFRGTEGEGTYKIALSEWMKVLDLSYATVIKALKECDELHLIDKEIGEMYTDEDGNPRRRTNGYTSVSQKERDYRNAEEIDLDDDSSKKQFNTKVLAILNKTDTTETRKNNLFNPSNTVWLTGIDWWIWHTTECEIAKAQGTRRFNKMKASPRGLAAYKKIEKNGKAVLRQKNADIQTNKVIIEKKDEYVNIPKESPFNHESAYQKAKAFREERELLKKQKTAEIDSRIDKHNKMKASKQLRKHVQ